MNDLYEKPNALLHLVSFELNTAIQKMFLRVYYKTYREKMANIFSARSARHIKRHASEIVTVMIQVMKINHCLNLCRKLIQRSQPIKVPLSLLNHDVILLTRYEQLHPTDLNPFKFLYVVFNLPNTSELDISTRMQIPIIRLPETQEKSPFKTPSGFKN